MRNLKEILLSINDAVWSFDLKKNEFIYINRRLSDLYETSIEEIDANISFWLKYIHPEDYQYALTEAQQAYYGKNVEIEYRIIVNDSIKWVSDKRVVLFDSENEPEAVSGILSDITSRKLSESQLSDTKAIFRYLFINNPNPLWIYDKNTLQFLAVNHAAISKYGYSEEEFLTMTIADIRPTEDVPELKLSVAKVDNTFINPKRYWRHLKKNGELMYVNISGHGINHNGREAEIIMAHDITVEVESRKEITLAKENLDTLINNIKEEIWSIDTNYCLISANNAFKKRVKMFTGRDIVIGQSVFLTKHVSEQQQRWKEYYNRALQGDVFTFIDLINFGDREPYHAETTMNPIKNGDKIIGVACLSTNIQEKLRAHEMIVEQNKKLREVISLVSHEIRGPVASLLGLISTFNKEDPSDPSNEEILYLITDMAQNLDGALHTLVAKSYSLSLKTKPTKNAQ